MKRFSWLMKCLIAAIAMQLSWTYAGAAPVRPNVVLLIADDLGYGEPGCYGGTEIPTPHINRLAAEGVRFTDGYVTAPYCAASRAGLLTGRYQTRFGFEFNPIGAQNDDPAIGLPRGERTIADALRDVGYVTGLVGKWHLGGTAQYHPQRRGFDEFFGFLHEGHYFVPPPWEGVTTWLRRKALPDGTQGRWTSPDGRVLWSTHMGHHEPDYDANNPILRNSQPVLETEYLTQAFTREAADFIRRHRAQPFCLCVAYNAVHSPMQATDADMRRFPNMADPHRRIFAAMLASLDDSVGTILKTMDEENLSTSTLVVFLSDNGGPTRELTSSNAPLRGEKGQLYEGGIRVPFIARWPGVWPAGVTETRPVISLDLAATIRSAAKCVEPAGSRGREQDGVDLTTAIANPSSTPIHDVLYWRMGTRAAVRSGHWKLVQMQRQPAVDQPWELFDLANDIGETTNLAPRHPDVAAKLRAAWELKNREMIDPLW